MQKIRTLPTSPGVYLYKNSEGAVIYVGKAKNLRARVRNYFAEGRIEDAKTDSLLREAVDLEYIVVANDKEALALENNLIKQKKPRFNILLRDDKTYPYIKLTLGERFPRVFVTRRLKKDGSLYFGPYFPANLAYRIVDLIHRHFLIPSCTVDLRRYHPRPCLQYYIGRCLGPCVEGLTTPERYQEAVRDVRLFLEGRQTELSRSLRERMAKAAQEQQYELAAKYRDLISTVEDLQDRQRIAAAGGSDADVFGYHWDNGMLAVNLFHMRGGRVMDRREFFWDEVPESALKIVSNFDLPVSSSERSAGGHADTLVSQPRSGGTAVSPGRKPWAGPETVSESRRDDTPTQHESASRSDETLVAQHVSAGERSAEPEFRRDDTELDPGAFFSSLLKQLYLDQQYVPRSIYVPVEFEDRETLADLLSECCGHKVEIVVPQRGDKRALLDLAANNAKQSYDQRFRVMKPATRQVQEALQDTLTLAELPRRIECFDISHIQGAETVASMVVWEDGKMKKGDYRKFIVRSVDGVDDFAAMREVVTRRYQRVQADKQPMPSLVLIDGGIGQLHAAAQALESLQITSQPLASIAKREEIIYVHGQEDEPVVLDHHSPVLHLVQLIRDEAHRFAVSFHRKRRQMRDRSTALLEIPGVGERTTRRLLEHFGSVQAVKEADAAALSAVVTRPQAEAILEYFRRS